MPETTTHAGSERLQPPALESRGAIVTPPTCNPFPPIIVLGIAIMLWVGLQTYALMGERDAMQATAAQLATQVEAAKKVRASVDSIATGVKRLSDGGNANARVIVDELARRGVTINPNSGQAAVPAK